MLNLKNFLTIREIQEQIIIWINQFELCSWSYEAFDGRIGAYFYERKLAMEHEIEIRKIF